MPERYRNALPDQLNFESKCLRISRLTLDFREIGVVTYVPTMAKMTETATRAQKRIRRCVPVRET